MSIADMIFSVPIMLSPANPFRASVPGACGPAGPQGVCGCAEYGMSEDHKRVNALIRAVGRGIDISKIDDPYELPELACRDDYERFTSVEVSDEELLAWAEANPGWEAYIGE